jgi:GNAT superfamily N-acetyltransferase
METSTLTSVDEPTIRTGPAPGDLGAVLALHADLYAREYGFDERFEAHVARGLADFADALGQARETGRKQLGRLWIAEAAGHPVGTIALTDEGAGMGQLRWFLVAPVARGSGLGRKLLSTLIDHARSGNFARIKLWTVEGLRAAAHLYVETGFRCTQRNPTSKWGQQLDELRYDLDLSSSPAASVHSGPA